MDEKEGRDVILPELKRMVSGKNDIEGISVIVKSLPERKITVERAVLVALTILFELLGMTTSLGDETLFVTDKKGVMHEIKF